MIKKFSLNFLGHSCFLIVRNKTALLMDPWLSEFPAMKGGWVPYPIIEEPPLNFLSQVQELYVWYSHEHSDHFDVSFCKTLLGMRDTVNFILPDFQSGEFVESFEEKIGVKPITLRERQKMSIEDSIFWMEFEKPTYAEHAAAIIELPEAIFVNSNDSLINETFSLQNGGKKVIYASQYSAVSPFPDNDIDFSLKKKQRLWNEHLLVQNESFLTGMKLTKADFGILCAGPAIKESTLQTQIIEENGAYDSQNMILSIGEKLGKKIKVTCPPPNTCIYLDGWDGVSKNNWLPSKEEKKWQFEKSREIFQKYRKKEKKRKKKLDCDIKVLLGDFGSRFTNMLSQIPDMPNASSKLLFPIDCSQDGRDFWVVDVVSNDGCVEYKLFKTKADQNLAFPERKSEDYVMYFVDCDHIGFVQGKTPFEELWYAGFVKVSQSSRGFQPIIVNVMLYYHSEKLFTAYIQDLLKQNNRMEIEYEGEKYSLKRFCPHRGGDLKNCEPDREGIITCPNHGWKFSVVNGKCVKGSEACSLTLDDYFFGKN